MRAVTSQRGRQTLKPELGQPIADEHFLLEDNKYIADVLADIRERKSRDTQSKARARARAATHPRGRPRVLIPPSSSSRLLSLEKLSKLKLDAEQHQFHCTSREGTGAGQALTGRRRGAGALQEAHVPGDRRDHHRAAVCHALLRAGDPRPPAGVVTRCALGASAP